LLANALRGNHGWTLKGLDLVRAGGEAAQGDSVAFLPPNVLLLGARATGDDERLTQRMKNGGLAESVIPGCALAPRGGAEEEEPAWDIVCDGCGSAVAAGARTYHCSACFDYDLCRACYQLEETTGKHANSKSAKEGKHIFR
jgi:hypothetical protein